jgi:hypothetical protein
VKIFINGIGEQVVILKEDNPNWILVMPLNSPNLSGYVPRDYLKFVGQSKQGSLDTIKSKSTLLAATFFSYIIILLIISPL